MARHHGRGWHFAGLEAGGFTQNGGPVVTPAGGIAMISGDATVRQSLVMLLSTRPGERVMRPTYGCPLHRLMFAPNDATTAGLAIHYVRQAVTAFEPRADILRLDAGHSADGEDAMRSTLFIWLDYRVRASQTRDSLTLAIDLAGDRP